MYWLDSVAAAFLFKSTELFGRNEREEACSVLVAERLVVF